MRSWANTIGLIANALLASILIILISFNWQQTEANRSDSRRLVRMLNKLEKLVEGKQQDGKLYISSVDRPR